MGLLTREQVLGFQDYASEVVDVPEWGGSVRVRVMSAYHREMFERAYAVSRFGSTRARVAAYTICDESGALLFSEDDVSALAEKSNVPLDRIFDVASRLNCLRKSDVDALEKNSEASR